MMKLSRQDIASVRRVLSHLDDAVEAPPETELQTNDLRLIARRILEWRRCRAAILNPAMLGEPAFEMLLCLYVSEEDCEPLTGARLAEMTNVPHSSAMRWIDYLLTKELVTRDPHPNDRRATVIELSLKGREALDSILRTLHDGGMRALPDEDRAPA